jgi:hypothetical protein
LDFDAAKKVSSQYEVSDKNEKVRKKFYLWVHFKKGIF